MDLEIGLEPHVVEIHCKPVSFVMKPHVSHNSLDFEQNATGLRRLALKSTLIL